MRQQQPTTATTAERAGEAMSCVCGGGHLARGIWRCPICKKRTRHLSQYSFSGYVATHFCGKCGAVTQDGEWLCRTKRERLHYIEWVRENWKRGRPSRIVLDEVMEEMAVP